MYCHARPSFFSHSVASQSLAVSVSSRLDWFGPWLLSPLHCLVSYCIFRCAQVWMRLGLRYHIAGLAVSLPPGLYPRLLVSAAHLPARASESDLSLSMGVSILSSVSISVSWSVEVSPLVQRSARPLTHRFIVLGVCWTMGLPILSLPVWQALGHRPVMFHVRVWLCTSPNASETLLASVSRVVVCNNVCVCSECVYPCAHEGGVHSSTDLQTVAL